MSHMPIFIRYILYYKVYSDTGIGLPILYWALIAQRCPLLSLSALHVETRVSVMLRDAL